MLSTKRSEVSRHRRDSEVNRFPIISGLVPDFSKHLPRNGGMEFPKENLILQGGSTSKGNEIKGNPK